MAQSRGQHTAGGLDKSWKDETGLRTANWWYQRRKTTNGTGVPEVVVKVDGDGRARPGDGYSCAEISRDLQEAEGGGGGGEEVVVGQAGAQVSREVDVGQQTAVQESEHSWRSQFRRRHQNQFL